MDTNTYSRDIRTVSRPRLWFGLIAAALAWAVDGLIGWGISWKSCYVGAGHIGGLSSGGIRALLAALTIVLLLVAITAGLVSYRNWRSLTQEWRLMDAEGRGREEFMALGGTFASVFFIFGIMLIGIPLVFANVCTRAW